MLDASDVVADRPQFSRRTIGTTRVLKSQDGKIRVQSDRLVWLSYHGKEFKNEWSDEDVLDQLLPLLDDLEVEEYFVTRAYRSDHWRCMVKLAMVSASSATALTISKSVGTFDETVLYDKILATSEFAATFCKKIIKTPVIGQ
jgi:hypothetical protein